MKTKIIITIESDDDIKGPLDLTFVNKLGGKNMRTNVHISGRLNPSTSSFEDRMEGNRGRTREKGGFVS